MTHDAPSSNAAVLQRLSDVLADLLTVVIGRTALLLEEPLPASCVAALRELRGCAEASAETALRLIEDAWLPGRTGHARAGRLHEHLAGCRAGLQLELGAAVRIETRGIEDDVWVGVSERVLHLLLRSAVTCVMAGPAALGGSVVITRVRAGNEPREPADDAPGWVNLLVSDGSPTGVHALPDGGSGSDAWLWTAPEARGPLEVGCRAAAAVGARLLVARTAQDDAAVLLRLPGAEPDLGARALRRAASAHRLPRGRGETVLVASPDATMRGYLADCTRFLGYRVAQAAELAEAFSGGAGSGLEPDALLVDARVTPSAWGASSLRLSSRAAPCGVVLLTGPHDAVPRGVQRLSALRAVLRSPFGPADLAHALRAALPADPVSCAAPA
jgi:hypothetical protein